MRSIDRASAACCLALRQDIPGLRVSVARERRDRPPPFHGLPAPTGVIHRRGHALTATGDRERNRSAATAAERLTAVAARSLARFEQAFGGADTCGAGVSVRRRA